jgi:glycosyltransferase involved in cell wall biosynthesis
MNNPGISVIMPTYNQHSFIRKAFGSLLNQTHTKWQLIIINDGSTDETDEIVPEFLKHEGVRYYKNNQNIGLGACLNMGMDHAIYDHIAYLPSDDFYYPNHLETLLHTLLTDEEGILAFSGIHRIAYSLAAQSNSSAMGQPNGFPLQLVQVMHKKTDEKWIERRELVTDDLFRLFWKKLSLKGMFLPTGAASCEWVTHAKQRHKIINDKSGGGICSYRKHYRVGHPVNFQPSAGVSIDETELYFPFQENITPAGNGLKIVLAGELAYNPERICAFEEHGHKLYGLWLDEIKFSNVVGPLPFGNVTDITAEELQTLQPDIIYAQLNTETVKFAVNILRKNPQIPFVWHFKEGPMFCQEYGSWDELAYLYTHADGKIFLNNEVRDWFAQYIPIDIATTYILDGDLPKNNWFTNDRSPLLSGQDGEIHTVLPGRPVGLTPEDIAILANQRIHFHFYGIYQDSWKSWLLKAKELGKGYVHTHPNCLPKDWVKEFSKYDAGWLHYFKSENEGDITRADWNDLNLPARLSTLAAAGLPMLQFDNSAHVVATQSITAKLDIGIFFNRFEDLGAILDNRERMSQLRKNVWDNRMEFTFDAHVEDLVGFFKKVIKNKKAVSTSKNKTGNEQVPAL